MKTILSNNPDIDGMMHWLEQRDCAFKIDPHKLALRRHEVALTGAMSEPIEVEFVNTDDAMAFFAWKSLSGEWLRGDPEVG